MSTIKDVAREAGVSVGTVSRYLNGAEIKEGNRIRIDEAINKLNFRVNTAARTLKTNKTKTVGIIIQNLTDIYSTTLIRHAEEELYRNGYNIFVCDTWGKKELEIEKVSLMLERMVDGLIIYPSTDDLSYLRNIVDKEVPVVTVDLNVNGFECDQVFTDNINATYSAVEWLISNNHKKIGIITGGLNYFTANERLKGYIRAMEDYALPLREGLIKTTNFGETGGYEALVELMSAEDRPSAIIACNYYTTIGAVKAVYDLGIRIPEELSLIGFDNLGLSEIIRPALSIIVQPMEGVGRCAAQTLLRRIQGDYEGFPTVSRLKTSLVLKDSTKKF